MFHVVCNFLFSGKALPFYLEGIQGIFHHEAGLPHSGAKLDKTASGESQPIDM